MLLKLEGRKLIKTTLPQEILAKVHMKDEKNQSVEEKAQECNK